MKKFVAFCLFVLASLACSSYVSAAEAVTTPKVDLQVNKVYFKEYTQENSDYSIKFLMVDIQNNGPDDFDGTFSVGISGGDSLFMQDFTGTIKAGEIIPLSVVGGPTSNTYSFYLDIKHKVSETNESNNYFSFVRDEPQIMITSGWSGLKVNDSEDTLFVLPGEMIYSQFCLQEANNKKDIIGIKYQASSYGFSDSCPINFDIQTRFEENPDVTYSYYSGPTEAKFNWMANDSHSAIDYFWLGNFSSTNDKEVGKVKNIFLNTTVALANLTNYSTNITRSIKTIDRLRCDVNNDGVVDQKDLDIMNEVVNEDLYNPCISFKNIYKEDGINYGAGAILFSRPDFASNCLLNIWLHHKYDQLVQGLGIGKPMSDIQSRFAIEQTANSYSVSGKEMTINAPDATLYCVTAATANGKMFKVSGQIGERIILPDSTSNFTVETVKLKNQEISTKLFSPKGEESSLMSISQTKNQLSISGSGKLTIFDLGGRQIFSGQSTGSLDISTANWPSGIYVAKIVSVGGKTQTTKLIK